MAGALRTTLEQIFLYHPAPHPIIKATSTIISIPWQYPIRAQLTYPFSTSNAQSLLEFTYRVSVHNRQISQNNPNPIPLNPPQFDIAIPLNTTFMLRKINVGWVFYSTTLNIVVIAFTATYNDLLVLLDIDYFQTAPSTMHNYRSGMLVHSGFWKLYHCIQDNLLATLNQYVNANTQIATTGLSLGGAISTLAAFDLSSRTLPNGTTILNPIQYSFASPRVLNILAAQVYNQHILTSYRVVNGSDIIPTLPAPIMPTMLGNEDFLHVETPCAFDKNLGNYYDNHITAYLDEYHILALP